MDARLLDDTQKMKLAVFDKMDSVVFLPIASDNVDDANHDCDGDDVDDVDDV